MFRDNWNVGRAGDAGAFARSPGSSAPTASRVADAARIGASSTAASVAMGTGYAARARRLADTGDCTHACDAGYAADACDATDGADWCMGVHTSGSAGRADASYAADGSDRRVGIHAGDCADGAYARNAPNAGDGANASFRARRTRAAG